MNAFPSRYILKTFQNDELIDEKTGSVLNSFTVNGTTYKSLNIGQFYQLTENQITERFNALKQYLNLCENLTETTESSFTFRFVNPMTVYFNANDSGVTKNSEILSKKDDNGTEWTIAEVPDFVSAEINGNLLKITCLSNNSDINNARFGVIKLIQTDSEKQLIQNVVQHKVELNPQFLVSFYYRTTYINAISVTYKKFDKGTASNIVTFNEIANPNNTFTSRKNHFTFALYDYATAEFWVEINKTIPGGSPENYGVVTEYEPPVNLTLIGTEHENDNKLTRLRYKFNVNGGKYSVATEIVDSPPVTCELIWSNLMPSQ